MKKKSWRTTTLGILAALAALADAGSAVLDDDPNTNPNWKELGTVLFLAGASVAARDNKVTSEQAGAAPAKPSVQVVDGDKTATS